MRSIWMYVYDSEYVCVCARARVCVCDIPEAGYCLYWKFNEATVSDSDQYASFQASPLQQEAVTDISR